jgi:hypothetical protein
VNGLRRTVAQPVKAIRVLDAVQASFKYQPEGGLSFNYSRNRQPPQGSR